jgi:uncharacterized membrane protein (UPF0182 family)
MPRFQIERGDSRRGLPVAWITLGVILVVLLFGARIFASYAIEVAWRTELGQLHTWLSMLWYSLVPQAAATVLCFAALWIAHARALKFARTSLREHRLYARATALVLLIVSYIVASASIDTWTVVRFAGSRGLPPAATVWHDSVFQKPLSFYLFDLPFYDLVRGYLLAIVILGIIIYWVAARGWQLAAGRQQWFDRMRDPANPANELSPGMLRLEGGLESKFLRFSAVVFLLAMAFRFFLARYEMVYNQHGSFLVGIDYVDQNIGLPMQWLLIFACLAAAGFVIFGRWILAAWMAVSLVVAFLVPRAVAAFYVTPNEISLQRPYIDTHIHATRSAYGLERHTKEIDYQVQPEGYIDVAKHRPLLDNVRLWDTGAFKDTITQRQALRTYYTFHDVDVDRYTIDGQYRQVLISPRELDIRQLPEANLNWNNPAFIYTHGYGVVLSEVSKMTSDGLPVLAIQDAPPKIDAPGIKLTRPEIYYGEVTHEPVFVHTTMEEFNYPAGESNQKSRYEGKGGFPISSYLMRIAAALNEGEAKILLVDYFTPNSRMMIRRKVRDRLTQLAGFLEWDADPYMVITDAGRLVWVVDGYTTSDAHPYSRQVEPADMPPLNYIRNSVKATIDAYDGETHLYIFAPDDPLIAAYQNLFPELFLPASAMPADIRAHARYPEMMFRIQAEIYRNYHMLDPQSFYNKEDVWDLALHASSQEGGSEPVTPTYMNTTLPGESQAEFLLMIPFTPHNKNNLIGVMAARCDGPHLGETVVLLLSKQVLIQGPMNISASINQDQTISKDLTLWNQQGSKVLHGQILVLPVGHNFLYVDPIYIRSNQASMPQLKKIVLAVGSRLIYTDTYDEALAQLSSEAQQLVQQATAPPGAPSSAANPAATSASPGADGARLNRVRDHLKRYRELAAQGKWSEAGKELEAIEAEVKQ